MNSSVVVTIWVLRRSKKHTANDWSWKQAVALLSDMECLCSPAFLYSHTSPVAFRLAHLTACLLASPKYFQKVAFTIVIGY